MSPVRDHSGLVLQQFNGLWARGDKDTTPIDHFSDCNNVDAKAENTFGTRPAIIISQNLQVPLSNIKRLYNYPTQTNNTIIALVYNPITGFGSIYHCINASLMYGPLLTILGMTDFAFTPYAGRGYISPFSDYQNGNLTFQKGLANEKVYVYAGDGTPARPAAGAGIATPNHPNPTVAPTYASNGSVGSYTPFSAFIQYTWIYSDGTESAASPDSATVVANGTNGQTATILVGPAGVVARRIYQTITVLALAPVNPPITFTFLINDNTTTSVIAATGGPYTLYTNVPFIYQQDATFPITPNPFGRGPAPTAARLQMTVALGAPGNMDPGFKIFGIVSQTQSGYLSPPSILTGFTCVGTNSVSFGNIPTSGDPSVSQRLLVSTITIPSFNGNLEGYEFFFVPGAIIPNNTDTFLNNISFYDAELLQDASYLFNNLTTIPAGAVMGFYHNRMCVACTFTDISLCYVSSVGQPEAIDQVNGLLIFPLDGNPITNLQEMRDVLYMFKRSKTTSFTDNGGQPATWPLIPIDNGLGTCVHGIATVLDSGGINIDSLLIATYQGISLFNGIFIAPELSWKIQALWQSYNQNLYGRIQIVNSPVRKKFYIVLPDKTMLIGDYANGMTSKAIKWEPWSFKQTISTVAIQNVNDIILGADIF